MLMRTYKTVKIELSPSNKRYKMSDNQSIFDILNLNYTFWYGKPKPSNELDPDKRHYQCVENSENTICKRIYEKSTANGNHIMISKKCPEIFDCLTLSYRTGKIIHKLY
jgi:hypothetical protein